MNSSPRPSVNRPAVVRKSQSSAARGRPRDPAIEARVLDAAVQIYGRSGWPGFSIDAIARASGVGKEAIYRRWIDRETLLQEAVSARWSWLGRIDHGSIADDLNELAERLFDLFAGPMGEVALQLRVDSRRHDAVRALSDPVREAVATMGRAIVRRAIARGELGGRATPALVLDLLVGAIVNHVTSTPPRLRERMIAGSQQFIDDIVRVVIEGFRTG